MLVGIVARGSPGARWAHSRNMAYNIKGRIGLRERDLRIGCSGKQAPSKVVSL